MPKKARNARRNNCVSCPLGASSSYHKGSKKDMKKTFFINILFNSFCLFVTDLLIAKIIIMCALVINLVGWYKLWKNSIN